MYQITAQRYVQCLYYTGNDDSLGETMNLAMMLILFVTVLRPVTNYRYRDAAKMISRFIRSLMSSNFAAKSCSPMTLAAELSWRSTSSILLMARTKDPCTAPPEHECKPQSGHSLQA